MDTFDIYIKVGSVDETFLLPLPLLKRHLNKPGLKVWIFVSMHKISRLKSRDVNAV